MDKAWHILRVIEGSEIGVSNLYGQDAYVPRRIERKFNRRQRKMTSREVSMLPGYVFLKTSDPRGELARPALNRATDDDPMGILNARLAIKGFLRNADRTYCHLRDDEVEALRVMEREYEAAPPPAQKPARRARVNIGQTVRIICTMFKGAVGRVLKITRSSAMVEIAGSIPVLVGLSDIEPYKRTVAA